MDEPKVPVGNTNRYLKSLRYRLVLPTGYARPWVTSKEKYLSSHQMWCVGEMVRKAHARQVILSSNPGQLFLPKNIALGTDSFTRCWWTRLLVAVTGYRFKNWYLRPILTGSYSLFSSSEWIATISVCTGISLLCNIIDNQLVSHGQSCEVNLVRTRSWMVYRTTCCSDVWNDYYIAHFIRDTYHIII